MPLSHYLHLPVVLGFIAAIAITALTAETLVRRKKIPDWAGRKLLHVVAISAVAFSGFFIYKPWLVYSIYAAFIIALLFVVSFSRLRIQETYGRKSWGIVWFPVAFVIVYYLFHQTSLHLVAISMLVLAFADAAAAVTGHITESAQWQLHSEPKTVGGSFAFFTSTILVLLLFPTLTGMEMGFRLSAVITLALTLTAFEAVSTRGSDNLWVPLSLAFLFYLMEKSGENYLVDALVLAAAFYGCNRKGWLSRSGTVAGWIMAMHIVIAGGWRAIIPPALFFAAGSLLGKLPRKKAAIDEKAGKPRDYWQVAANGLAATLCLLLYAITQAKPWLVGFTAAMACSLADTAASDVGLWKGGRPWDLLSGKRVAVGDSGGVTPWGVVGAAAGSLLMAALVMQLFKFYLEEAALVASAGVAGMLLDSLMGSRLQARYENINGDALEYPADGFILKRGFRWVDNDVINLLSTGITALIATGIAWI